MSNPIAINMPPEPDYGWDQRPIAPWEGGWRFVWVGYSEERDAAELLPPLVEGAEIVFEPEKDWRSGRWRAYGVEHLQALGLALEAEGTYQACDLPVSFLPCLLPSGVMLAEAEVGTGRFLCRSGARCFWFERRL